MYRTVKVIAQRMGVTSDSVMALHRDYGFPLWRDFPGTRGIWCTSEDLILQWQWTRARLDREYLRLEKCWRMEPSPNGRPLFGRRRYLAVMRRYRKLVAEGE